MDIFINYYDMKNIGGTAFLELSFCKLNPKVKVRKLTSISSIKSWNTDSLFIPIEMVNEFIDKYNEIFVEGVYNNLKVGPIDIYGINYFDSNTTIGILKRLLLAKPSGHEVLAKWLVQSKEYNGIYIRAI